jgi:hypothetical protein
MNSQPIDETVWEGKKRLKGIVGTSAIFFFLSTLLLSCSSAKSVLQAVDEDSISVKSPMTISDNDLFPITGKHQYLT